MRILTSGFALLIMGCSPLVGENTSETASLAGSAERSQDAAPVMRLDTSKPRPEVSFQFADQAPARAVFDTGASGSVVAKSYAEAVQLPVEQTVQVGSGAGGPLIEGFLTTLKDLRIDGYRVGDVPAAAIDFPLPPEHEGAVAVLSPSIFAGSYLTLSFRDGTMTAMPKDEGEPLGTSYPYDDGPRPLPSLPLKIGTFEILAHLDTGSRRHLILPYAVRDSVPLKAPVEPAGTARVVTGERKMYKSVIDGPVEIGPITLEDPDVLFMEGLPHGNVGTPVLERMDITLDPEEFKLWVRPLD